MDNSLLLKIANMVRDELDVFVKNVNAWTINPRTLCGLCAISSMIIKRVFEVFNEPIVIIEGIALDDDTVGSHCWCETADGWVIDCTSSQFNKNNSQRWPRALVLRKRVYNQLAFADQFSKRIRDDEALCSIDNWFYEQNPKTYEQEISEIVDRVVGSLV